MFQDLNSFVSLFTWDLFQYFRWYDALEFRAPLHREDHKPVINLQLNQEPWCGISNKFCILVLAYQLTHENNCTNHEYTLHIERIKNKKVWCNLLGKEML